jgi:ThiF family protein
MSTNTPDGATSPNTELALSRTMLLLRDHIGPMCSDATILTALTSIKVVIASDAHHAESGDAQTAIVASALLAARSGASVSLALPDVPLRGPQPPLRGTRLASALSEGLRDLLPGVSHSGKPGRYDVAIVIGDSRWKGKASRVLRLNASSWSGTISADGGQRWRATESPFGALAAAGLAAGEVFKIAVNPLRGAASDVAEFDALFAPTARATVCLAPPETPLIRRDLESFDMISGGAIVQAALFTLARIPGVSGRARIVEPEQSDITNLNRYALLLRSDVGTFKAQHLVSMAESGLLGGISLKAVDVRYDRAAADSIGPLAPRVLVGVDDIPSRWLVQSQKPEWLGVGATTHYGSMASFHATGLACARCLHPRDDLGGGPIPTVAFVSHWAGLWLATLFARAVNRHRLPQSEQTVFMTSLRAESRAAIWFSPVAPDPGCQFSCAA